MAVPNVRYEDIEKGLKYIDVNGIPSVNESTRYDLVSADGKRYPPKYVLAVADHLANGTEISTLEFNSIDAKNYLSNMGFTLETKQHSEYELTISTERIESTDERFTLNNLMLGDNYKTLDAFFRAKDGEVIRRVCGKGEKRRGYCSKYG